jgi:hypothetical protein
VVDECEAVGSADRDDMTRSRFHEAEDLYHQAITIFEYHRDVKQEAAALDDLAIESPALTAVAGAPVRTALRRRSRKR